MLKVGFYGLSHLGLCYLAAFLKKGFKVIAVDESKKLISDLNKRKLPVYEKGIDIIYKKNNKFHFSHNINDLNKADLIFYSRDVITNRNNNSDYNLVRKEIKKIDKKIKKKKSLIVLSQIYPGFLRSLKFKRNLYYKVETLIFGKAFQRALKPERIILGKKNYNSKIDKKIILCLKKFTKNIIITNYETAELTKIAINLFLISSVMTSNSIARYCETINANWPTIKKSLKLDKRIGKFAYLNPSPGLSGGNLERDLKNAETLFTPNNLYKTWIGIDKNMKNWTLEILKKKLKKNSKLLIVGSVYKKGTESLKNSYSMNLLSQISKLYEIQIYEENSNLFKKFSKFKKLKNYHRNNQITFDAIIFVNNYYEPSTKNYLKSINKKTIVIDPYGYFVNNNKIKNLKYFSIGEYKND